MQFQTYSIPKNNYNDFLVVREHSKVRRHIREECAVPTTNNLKQAIMKDDRVSTARQFFVWLSSRMQDGDSLNCYDEGGVLYYELINENKIILARFSEDDGLYEY